MNPILPINRSTRLGAAMFLLFAVVPPAAVADALPLFSNQALLEATIEAPLSTIMRERGEDKEYQGLFRYLSADGSETRLDLQLRVRGKFRARKSTCGFAPLRLNFKKKQVANTEFDGQDKLKLVTHCKNSGGYDETYTLRELMSYRFLAALTENAFRTRLLKITYIDSDGKAGPRTKFAFLIESDKELAGRIDARRVKTGSVEYAELDPVQTNLVSVFQFFIGNTDYSVVRGAKNTDCCHNVALFQQTAGSTLPVPYDFDFSGMVDAPYAGPNPRFNIDRVTDRFYRGVCRNNDRLPVTLDLFRAHRDDFYRLLNDTEHLKSSSKNKMRRFLNSFYRLLDNDNRIQNKIIRKCSGPAAPVDPI